MMRVFKSNIHHKLLPVLFLAFLLDSCGGSCFFPAKLQGDFVMQKTAGSQVQYSKLNITTDSISIWGVCHRRIGNNVILENLMRGYRCYGCYHLNLRSKNVLQVRVRAESLDKCYTDEDNVLRTCPGEYLGSEHNPSERLKEFLLYKTNEAGGEDIRKEYCPFNGHYKFTYNLNEGSENKFECSDFTSEMDSCPSASALNLRFRKCSFVNPDITFQCLGHWAGPGSQKYLALLDTRDGGELTVRAQYRCAIYQEDTTGSIYIAFSSDSTCTSDLRNAADGFETMILNPVAALSLPDRLEDNSCRFPSWAQGLWEYIEIKNNTLIYKDHTLFETSTITCVQPDIKNPEKYVIFRRNQCGYERYTCIWMKKRALNVMEFQMGNSSSINYNGSLCDDANFPDDTAWITQGKMDVVEKTPCPIAGEYTGEIPDNTGLCAKLYSDCNKPEIMYYTIANCSEPQVYEEREYQCLGQWEEGGLMYTYTRRKDVGSSFDFAHQFQFECFVGSITSNTDIIYIQEAGEHCQRHVDPKVHQIMKLMKRSEGGSCFGGPNQPTSNTPRLPPPHPRPTSSWYSSKRPPEPTKPWKPITAPPRDKNVRALATCCQYTLGLVFAAMFLNLWI